MEQLTGSIKPPTNKSERLRFINGRELPSDYQTFAFDGCHKIYLCANDEAEVMMEGYGYQILPISQLPTAWKNSCSLRFIQDAETFEDWVPQFKGARFKGFGKKAA